MAYDFNADEVFKMAEQMERNGTEFYQAAAGGGGRGIRVAHDPEEFERLAPQASVEAKSAFGDGGIYIEKLIQRARHIEVQIAADRHGNALAVGCRDCSVQRRHQKVLEEAPPPGVRSGRAPSARAPRGDRRIR